MILNKFLIINSLVILISRIIDLVTTYFVIHDFVKQEQNILVRIFNLNFFQFCIIEILIAFILILTYLYSFKNCEFFRIKTDTLFSFSKTFLYKNSVLTNLDFLLKMSFKRVLILFGSIIPTYIFITSLIFSLNNIWVYLYMENNEQAIILYNYLSTYYLFDFVIFILPVIILIYLLYKKLKSKFYFYNAPF